MAESGNSTLQHPVQQSFEVKRLGFKQPRVKKERNQQAARGKMNKTCHLCGKSHESKDCPARDWDCFACGKKGHISLVCRTKPKKSSRSTLKKSSRIHKIKQKATDSEEKELFAMKLVKEINCPTEFITVVNADSKSCSVSPVAKMKICIEEKSVVMEVDTGTSASVMPLERYISLFGEIQLQECSKIFVTLTRFATKDNQQDCRSGVF